MFDIQKKQRRQMIIVRLAQSVVGGRMLIAGLFSIPIVILIYLCIRRPSATTKKLETRLKLHIELEHNL